MPKDKKEKKEKFSAKEGHNYYCGAGELPRGKIRAPVDYCIERNQVRYYGLIAIDPALIERTKRGVGSLNKEKVKLQGLISDAKLLVAEFKGVKLSLEHKDLSESARKKLLKKKEELLVRRDKLKKKQTDQREIIARLEREEKKLEKAQAKEAEKKKSSGSKTAKKKSSGSKTAIKKKPAKKIAAKKTVSKTSKTTKKTVSKTRPKTKK